MLQYYVPVHEIFVCAVDHTHFYFYDLFTRVLAYEFTMPGTQTRGSLSPKSAIILLTAMSVHRYRAVQ